MPNPFWPVKIKVNSMLLLVLWALAALVIWAIVHVGARDDPPEWDEPDIQPGDPWVWSSLPEPPYNPPSNDGGGKAGRTLVMSDNLTAADGGPVSIRWRQ